MPTKRKTSPALWAGLVLALGLGYAAFATATGLMIPCPIRAVTGLYCPGCGVSRMCLALLRLDFYGAWRANPALLLSLPVMGGLGVWRAIVQKRTGNPRPTKGESAVTWALVAALLIFGVARNLPCCEALRPPAF